MKMRRVAWRPLGLLLAAALGLAACGLGGPSDTDGLTAGGAKSSATATTESSTGRPSTSPAPTTEPTTASTTRIPPPATRPPTTTRPTTTAPTTRPTSTTAPTLRPAPGGPGLPTAWRGIDLERVPTQRPVVALTFDGGSSDAAVPSILATLGRYGVRATFFVTGDFARSYPQRVRAIAQAGHAVGNHSNTHRSYPDLTDAQIRADLATAEASVAALTGRPARPLFRFPYGARTDADIRVVNGAGYLPVRWTVDTLGWKGTSGGLSAAAVTRRVIATAAPGQIVLMHVGANPDDGTTLDAAALPQIIEGLRARGYQFTALDTLVR